MSQKILDRYAQLVDEARAIESLSTVKHHEYGSYETLGDEGDAKFLEWKVKVKNLIIISCGEKSIHFKCLIQSEEPQSYDTNTRVIQRLTPVLTAAYDDLKSGFLLTFKQIVQAEVFDSELEQAKSLLDSGYKNAAAVIAGTVLETAIKELCLNNGITLDRKKLTHLNDDLAKASIYNKLQQKQITALADIRNNAAHGDFDQFTKEDVERMIDDIERFLLNHLS
ncbi:HEPN domain-containing protein [Acinetobacter guillouiae]|uniref:HEPN domain-containing protein n=1 Tax=Acinetobacter guillouiae TaxID=106649 RepID=UPI0032B494B9